MSQSSLHFNWVEVVDKHWDANPEAPYSIHDNPLKLQLTVFPGWALHNKLWHWSLADWDDGDFEGSTYARGWASDVEEAKQKAEESYFTYRLINPKPKHQEDHAQDNIIGSIARLVAIARNMKASNPNSTDKMPDDILKLVGAYWEAKGEDAFVVGAPHSKPEDCPSWYDGCNCTIETLNSFIEERQRTIADFDTWFNGQEGFGFRAERFYDLCNTPEDKLRNSQLRDWLFTSFKLGRERQP